MPTIKAKIVVIEEIRNGANITVEFDDGKGKWKKTYTQKQQVIKAQQFKEILAQDLRRDLKINTQLEEINPLIGKTFNIEL